MHWLRLILSGILASELILRLPLVQSMVTARGAAAKVARLLPSKRVSDHWKERMLPVYARIIATQSVRFFALLCVALLPVVLVGLTHPGGIAAWLGLLLQPLNMLVLFAVSVGYVLIRVRARRG